MIRVEQTDTFRRWLDALRDRQAQLRIRYRIDQMGRGAFGDWKSVGGPIAEVRLNYGPGYRLYFTRRGDEIVILLAGGDKSSQARDIARARDLERQL